MRPGHPKPLPSRSPASSSMPTPATKSPAVTSRRAIRARRFPIWCSSRATRPKSERLRYTATPSIPYRATMASCIYTPTTAVPNAGREAPPAALRSAASMAVASSAAPSASSALPRSVAFRAPRRLSKTASSTTISPSWRPRASTPKPSRMESRPSRLSRRQRNRLAACSRQRSNPSQARVMIPSRPDAMAAFASWRLRVPKQATSPLSMTTRACPHASPSRELRSHPTRQVTRETSYPA